MGLTKEEISVMIQRLKEDSGDEEAFSEIVRRYWNSGIQAARSQLAKNGVVDDTVSQDIVQESWIKVLKSIGSLKNPDGFKTWFCTIVRNTATDYLKSAVSMHETRMPVTESDEGELIEYDPADERIEFQPEMSYDEKARAEIIADVLSHLNSQQREAVIMYYFDEMTMKEIAERLDVPMSTVVGRINTAKSEIKSAVSEMQRRDDIKLYNLSPLPFFLYLLKGWKSSKVKLTRSVVSSAMQKAGLSRTAASAGKTVSKAAGRSTVSKVLIGTAAAAVVTVGNAAGVHAWRAAQQKAADETAVSELSETPEITEKPVRKVIWTLEPSLEFSGIREIEAIPYMASDVIYELYGYGTQWSINYEIIHQMIPEMDQLNYNPDAIEVIKDGYSGIYDFDGNEVYPIDLEQGEAGILDPEGSRAIRSNGYVLTAPFLSDSGEEMIFSTDFRSLYAGTVGGMGWGAFGPRRVIDGGIYIYNQYDDTLKPLDWENESQACLMDVYDHDGIQTGRAIVSKSGSIFTVPGESGPFIINGFLAVKKDGKWGFQSAETGEMLTDYLYDEVKYFEVGYAPVKKNGKWGYLDSEGNEVTDFIFEEASALYNGKAYVRLDGKYGILNLLDTLAQRIDVTADSCKTANGD